MQADIIVTPCPVYRDRINEQFGTKFEMPVVYYSQLMAVARAGGTERASHQDQELGEVARQ